MATAPVEQTTLSLPAEKFPIHTGSKQSMQGKRGKTNRPVPEHSHLDRDPVISPCPATEMEDIGELVREQIEYDVLLTRDNPLPLLDCAVEVISRVLCTPPKETLTIQGAVYPVSTVQRCFASLDANETEFAVQAVRSAVDRAAKAGTPIRNLRAYLLCCLFTAKTDFAASLVY